VPSERSEVNRADLPVRGAGEALRRAVAAGSCAVLRVMAVQ
jgi:hypothetical protein